MAARSNQAYKDAAELITFYNLPGGKERYDPFFKQRGYTYRGRTKLKTILLIIAEYNRLYSGEVKEALTSSDEVGDLFQKFYTDNSTKGFNAFKLAANQNITPLSPEQDQLIEQVSSLPDDQHDKAVSDRIEGLFRSAQPAQNIPSPPRQVSAPSFLKDILSQGTILIRKLFSRIPLPVLIGSGVGGVGGFFLGSFLGGLMGMIGGGVLAMGITTSTGDSDSTDQAQSSQQSLPSIRTLNNLRGLGEGLESGLGSNLARGGARLAISSGVRAAAVGLFTTPVGWAILAIIALFILIFVILRPGDPSGLLNTTTLFPPFQQQTSSNLPTTTSTTSSGSDINTCSFTGASGSLKVGNPALGAYITNIASKVGVPASVLAGIVRIESPSAFSSTDSSYLQNDYDATISSANAVGITQFLPETFVGVFETNKADMNSLFQKTDVSTSIPSQTNPPPSDNILRITSIKDEIIATAFKIKNDKASAVGSDSSWNAGAVRAVAQSYQGACPYGGNTPGNYCDDLATSFSSCQTVSIVGPTSANLLYDQINQFCGGSIRNYNTTCVDSNSPPIDSRAKSEIDYNVTTYDGNLQCVGFVQAIVAETTGQPLFRAGNAIDFAHTSIPGYKFVDNQRSTTGPQPGDIPIWDIGPVGHIAYVIKSYDTNTFDVAEANFCPNDCGTVGIRTVTRDSSLQGWLSKL